MTATGQVAIVGGGILGVALARQLAAAGRDVTLFEKEPEVAVPQTGRNSNVVYAGLYYVPGSEKAVLCRRGRTMLKDFCTEQDLPYDERGKILVARDDTEAARLHGILERAHQNGASDVELLSAAALADLEPHVRGTRALLSPTTAITDFAAVTAALATDAVRLGATIRTGTQVVARGGRGRGCGAGGRRDRAPVPAGGTLRRPAQ